MAVRPRLTTLHLSEAAYMLQGLYLVDIAQLEAGYPPILAALRRGSCPRAPGGRLLRYIGEDPDEVWQTIRDLWREGGGDCEDLAAAVAAEFTVGGIPARPVIRRIRPGLAHAVVQVLGTGQIVDPSKIGGMGEHYGGRIHGDTWQPGASVSGYDDDSDEELGELLELAGWT